MTWRDLEHAAPEIASLGKERLQETRVALLATLWRDGSPRISPVEPFFAAGHLLFGAMAWTLKVRDLEQDPRCTLHSAITGPNAGEGELKLFGRAIEADDDLRAACRDGWWTEEPHEAARVFSLTIEEAAFVTWDYEGGEMTVRRWSAGAGFKTSRRSYP
jgi:Pyridoxamine 5'-phosphate oxidase